MTRKPLVLAALASAALCAAAPAAQAQGLLDLGRVILGIPTEQKDPIDYRERAPIVVPPNQQTLRPPVEARPADQRRANWPQDPDALARRQAAEEARKPVFVDSISGREVTTRRMTLEEIRAGRVAGAELPRAGEVPKQAEDWRGPTNIFGGLSALREMDRKDVAAGRNGENLPREEPKREFLTDPPSGLRRPSEAAAFKATREGRVGPRQDPSPFDIYREGPNTR